MINIATTYIPQCYWIDSIKLYTIVWRVYQLQRGMLATQIDNNRNGIVFMKSYIIVLRKVCDFCNKVINNS